MAGIGRAFGVQPRIDDGVRGDALVVESVAGTDPIGGETVRAEGWSRWMTGVQLLVRIPGWESYELCPKMWFKRDKYPLAGTALPVTVARDDASSLRIAWDEVPDIDDWIAAGHAVFTDPDGVEAQLRRELAACRERVRHTATHASAERAAELSGAPVDREALHAAVARLEPETVAPAPRAPAPADRASGRVIAKSPTDPSASKTYGEVVLSVAVPGRPRFGTRWRGWIPAAKFSPTWTDVPVSVDGDRVEILWREVRDGLDVANELVAGANARLQETLASVQVVGPPSAADPLDQLKLLTRRHADGAVSDEEFAREKARLLDQI